MFCAKLSLVLFLAVPFSHGGNDDCCNSGYSHVGTVPWEGGTTRGTYQAAIGVIQGPPTATEGNIAYCYPDFQYGIGLFATYRDTLFAEDQDFCWDPVNQRVDDHIQLAFTVAEKTRNWSPSLGTVESIDPSNPNNVGVTFKVTFSGGNPQTATLDLELEEDDSCDYPDGYGDASFSGNDASFTLRLWRGPYYGGHSVAHQDVAYAIFKDEILPEEGPNGESWSPAMTIRERWQLFPSGLTVDVGANNGSSTLTLGEHEVYDLFGIPAQNVHWQPDPNSPFIDKDAEMLPTYGDLILADPLDGSSDNAATLTGTQTWEWLHGNAQGTYISGAPAGFNGWIPVGDSFLVFIGINFSELVASESHSGTVGYLIRRGSAQIQIPVQYVNGEPVL